ncbi:hypothetical protein E2I00_008544 [Balaenoptera physalus]|uniref:SH2 domain-containing protein n=1 Tax=Balaenoptera physalus TaxID=9770 RepID=A0A643BU75_BALPH|nr:hypothetical protein E2I00_008544 [Balaenoptera physalus]
MVPCWNHGNITRSKAEELLSRTGKDGSFLVRASESVSRAYALCVLLFNVLLLGICPQASEGVPMRFFTKLDQLIEFYKKENMGLVTHLQYPVPLEEEDAGDELEEETVRPREPVQVCECSSGAGVSAGDSENSDFFFYLLLLVSMV